MSFSFVRGFIHSAFGQLNPNHLPKIFPFLSELLITWLPEGRMKKGLMKGGRKERFLGIEDGPVPSTSTSIAVKWMTHHDWEFHR